MKNFFKKHPEMALIGLAVFLIFILGAYFFWGVRVLLTSVNTSLKIPTITDKPIKFDLESARALNLNLE